MSTISQNIFSIRERIKDACSRSGRRPEDIKLIAVTKTVNVERIMEAVNSGVIFLGENKVQEIMDKYTQIPKDVEWHMIGHLQTNKVKYIVDKVSMIHSLDSIKLAQEIDKRCQKIGRIIDVLVEINIGGEENKYGIAPVDIIDFLYSINCYKNIKVRGLMTVAPLLDDMQKVRPYFKKMKELFDEVKFRNIPNIDMQYLSMGMTKDFEVAVEEGSNILRIGTAIFGPRNY